MNNSDSSLKPFEFSQPNSNSRSRYDSFLLVLIGIFISIVYYNSLAFIARQQGRYEIYTTMEDLSTFVSAVSAALITWGCFTVGRSKFRLFALLVGVLEILSFIYSFIDRYE